MKVHELAKDLNLSNNELIGKLKSIGIEVKSHLSSLTDEEYSRFKGNTNYSKEMIEPKKSSDSKKIEAAPHIIRRNVKVINTDNDKKEIEEITTNISGEIKKSYQTVRTENRISDNSYSKEGLGVVTPKFNNSNSMGVSYNRNSNVVITRNGKKIDEEVKIESVKSIEKEDVEKSIMDVAIVKEKIDVEKIPEIKVDGNLNYVKKPYINNNGNRTTESRPYNNSTYERRPYNNGTPGTTESRPYNNNNSTYERRPYNNGTPGTTESRPYNNNNSTYERRPYNNGTPGTQGSRPYNNNSSTYERRPYNNGTPGTQGSRPPYNNNNSGGFRNNRFSPPMSQVDKFMKQSTDNQPIEQKETRDYSLTLIDKKKYNNTPTSVDGKKTAINKNDLREQHTRVETSKLKGLEVNSSSSMIDLYERNTDSVRRTNRKRKDKRISSLNQTKIIPMTEVKLYETMTVKELAEAVKKQASEIIKKLFSLGILATVNQEIDFDTAFLIASEFGIKAEKHIAVTEEDILFDDTEDLEIDMEPRPPIVVVMGHVDHGKTSLLDRIRSTQVVSGEAGGITQHIGAYKVEINKKQICFLDTPGHEAFTEMRARGAHVTDIAVIVVAADDGIKPQTIEAIDHAKAAGVSIIVAINKIDKQAANVDKVKQELLEVGLISEEWGGDTICVPISAVTGEGVDNLLEMILLTAEMKELRANPNKQAKGTVIEAKLDKNIGTITSLLVQRGTLNVGDTIVVGNVIGKVRAMKDDKGKKVKSAGPSTPVEIIGLGVVPQTGDVFYEVEDEKTAKQLVSKRKADVRRNLVKQGAKVTLEDLFGQIKDGEIKDLNLIVKADVQGTLEALKNSLEKISNEEVKVKIIHASTGGIKESDVTLASVSNAIIIGFNVRPESTAIAQAEKEKVDLRLYSVIYNAINDVESAMKGMLKPIYKEVIHGTAEVRVVFKVSNVGTIAGCYVKSGSIIRNTMSRIIRESIVIAEAKIETLKREKDDTKEIREGYECGIKLEKFNDIIEGDIIECYEMVEEKRK
ncbi:MAG: translation initiation factor IF-2 [Clostridia bacterium]|nr:translation initiation factor IF-2 [Clostridia bacterium]MDD4386671.1 translation initiation factor IF-2 [Clostridia bacterium]